MYTSTTIPEPRKGGFEDALEQDICLHREHDPLGHMVIPQGKQYRHICPGCGQEIVIRPSIFRL